MEHLIPNILTFLLPYLTKIGETFYTEAIKEAAKDSWKEIKSFFKDEKSEQLINNLEKGKDDNETISEFKKLFEQKVIEDNSFKEILINISNAYHNEISEVLKKPTYKFDNYGNVVIDNQIHTTNNNTTINNNFANFITMDDEEFISLINKNIINIGSINTQQKENIESKLLNVKYNLDIKNYKRANEICDDIREVYAQVPEVWEYKAICEFFADTQKNETINNSARNIIACLNIAKERRNYKINNTHIEISKEIANRYYKILLNRIFKIIPNNIKTYKEQIKLFKLISELKTCFEIYNDNKFLYIYIEILSGLRGFTWLSLNYDKKNTQTKSFRINQTITLDDNSPTSEIIQNLITKAKDKIVKNGKLDYKLPDVIFYSEQFSRTFNYIEFYEYIKSLKDDKTKKLNRLEREIRGLSGFFNEIFYSNRLSELNLDKSIILEEINELKNMIT